MSKINANPKVMEFFPSIPNFQQTVEFIERMQYQFKEKGFCYFAVDDLSNDTFIGFIGLSEQNYPSDFTPCIDIGWRLSQDAWGKGLATEGAKRCLDFAFNDLGLKNIKAICPAINIPSERVMQKIGMTKIATFHHSMLKDHPKLETCILYEIMNNISREN
jgi:RimJ/RimL family protein N-acetyltransferase